MDQIAGNYTLYFHDSRMSAGVLGRFLIRLVSYSFYAVSIAFISTALLGDITSLWWLGAFLALMIGDRLLHINHAERNLQFLPKKGRVNVALYISPGAFRILAGSFEHARLFNANIYLACLRSLLKQSEIKRAFMKTEVDIKEFEAKCTDYFKQSMRENTREPVAERMARVEAVAIAAFGAAQRADVRFIEIPDLLTALGTVKDDRLMQLFEIFEITDNLENIAILVRFSRHARTFGFAPSTIGGFAHHTRKIHHRIMNRAWTARPTPTLDAYGEDITDLARAGLAGFMIGHAQEYNRMVDVLSKPRNPNILLVGEAGVGKHTLISHLAFQMTRDRVPPMLFDRRIVSLSVGSLITGVDEGKLAERLNRIIDEITDAGNVILYIPDIHNLVRTSGTLQMSAADILLPAIKGTDFSVIGATYPYEFKQFVKPNSDFASAFEVVNIQEVTEQDALRILIYASIIIEHQMHVEINFPAIRTAVTLAHKYFRAKLLPASAEDLLKEAVVNAQGKERKSISVEDVIAIAEHKINVPLGKITGGEAEALLHLEETIHERFIDQEEAVKAVARALREYRSGLTRKGSPIATFLFVGPTGVGKTELSKILAKLQFGSSDFMIRFDMSEYQDKQSFFRFIGSPDGTVRGALTDAVREKPYCLLLLDEFEKAHPDILNLFLQVFDEGRLTDNLGRVADFQNTIIIATSNAHSTFIKTEIEAHHDIKTIADELKKKLTDYFKPELINRFSQIIVFRSLSQKDTLAVTRLLLKEVSGGLKESHAVTLVFDESAIQRISELGYDPVFGARPLRNVISDRVRAVLAEKILKSEIQRGDKIVITTRGDELSIEDVSQNAQ